MIAAHGISIVALVLDALAVLHDPAAWTEADAEAFWKCVGKARFG